MKRPVLIGSIAVVVVGVAVAAAVVLPRLSTPAEASRPVSVVPQPERLQTLAGGPFVLDADDQISTNDAALEPVADYLSDTVTAATGLALASGTHGARIQLILDTALAAEQYELRVDPDGIRISAGAPEGVFWGVQSLRQLLSASAPWAVPAVEIDDAPRFGYRGAMLDVARHFFPVEAVERYIDDLALLKINYLHLHLTDDQGWRIQIASRPLLAEVGGRYAVGTSPGGYYTHDDYRELVSYAQSRFITIVPEIDMPGHTNAALTSYGELNPDGQQAKPYTGIEVGFSTLDANSEATYDFVDDVVREVAELTPGPYLHIGGDESRATSDEDFATFVTRTAKIAAGYGKTVIGWHEMGAVDDLPAGTIGQYWNYTTPQSPETAEHATSLVDRGGQLIMSPANVAYLDMKYDLMTKQGQTWADGFTSVEDAYSWDPAAVLPGVGDPQILGVEAPLWSETLLTIDDIEFMAFPRIAALAEVAWSPQTDRDFAEFAPRLATFGVLLDDLGIRYNRAAGVPWVERAP